MKTSSKQHKIDVVYFEDYITYQVGVYKIIECIGKENKLYAYLSMTEYQNHWSEILKGLKF